MSYTASAIFSFGASQTGLSDLRVQPRTIAGATTGSAISTGFTEIGQGVYAWAGSVPDDAATAHAYRLGDATVLSVRQLATVLATAQPLYAPAKAGDAMALTGGERTTLSNAIESQIIDDTDSEKVLEAITNKIASVNPSLSGLTLAAIASQVRTNLATELGRIDAAVSSRSTYAGADTAGTTTLLTRLTEPRGNLLDNLDPEGLPEFPAAPSAEEVAAAVVAAGATVEQVAEAARTKIEREGGMLDLVDTGAGATAEVVAQLDKIVEAIEAR